MQKLDFVENLKVIVNKLQSQRIVSHFINGFSDPNRHYNYGQVTPLLFSSKSNYDQIKDDERYREILEGLSANEIYQEQSLAALSTLLRNSAAEQIFTTNSIKLFNFHNALLQLEGVTNNIFKKEAHLDIQNIEEGEIIFRVVINNNENLTTEKYVKIFSTLDQLVKVISILFDEENQKSEVMLLDSGSDTNIGIKTGVETAKSIFLIFKEVWSFITNNKLAREKNKNEALLNSLTVRKEILEKVKEGVITETEAQEYTHIIKTRTDELIGLKVLPKQIVQEINQVDNKKLLEGLDGVKLLGSGE